MLENGWTWTIRSMRSETPCSDSRDRTKKRLLNIRRIYCDLGLHWHLGAGQSRLILVTFAFMLGEIWY